MPQKSIGIIMNGVSGRMGYRQHLVRSILAIRDQGGVRAGDGERVQVEPLLVGRSEAKLAELARAPRHRRLHDRPRRRARRPALGDLRRLPRDQGARRGAAQGDRGGQGDLHREADRRERRGGARARRASPGPPGSRTGSCTTSSTCPACRSSRRLIDSGFFGRILSVRGEFGYWVFEGDWQPAQRPSWNYRAEDGGGIIVDMFPHWNYVLENLFGRVTVGLRARRHAHPDPRRRGRAALRRHRRRRRLRDLRARRRRHRAAQLQLDRARQPRGARRVPGRRHPRQRRRGPVRLPDPAPQRHAEAGVEPRPRRRPRLRRRLDRGPRQRRVRERLQDPVGAVPPPRPRGRPARVRLPRGRPRRPAGRGGSGELAHRRPRRPARARRCPTAGRGGRDDRVATIDAARRGRRRHELADGARLRAARRAAALAASPTRPRTSCPRVGAENVPGAPADIDWDATLAFRHHVWSWGLGVADAMDTAQRNMGLDAEATRELIARSAAEARSVGRRAGGRGEHRPRRRRGHLLQAVIDAYVEQLHFAEDHGAGVVLMASRHLARAATSAADYERVYREVLARARRPGGAALARHRVRPAARAATSARTTCRPRSTPSSAIMAENADRVRGHQDEPARRGRRDRGAGAAAARHARMFTGDDFHYVGLIEGDGERHSDALLGAFALVAPHASAAIQALDAGDPAAYRRILGPTEALARQVFAAPTFHYKTGVAFLSWLNGHQQAFSMVGGLHAARSLPHLSTLVRARRRGRARSSDPDLAARRWNALPRPARRRRADGGPYDRDGSRSTRRRSSTPTSTTALRVTARGGHREHRAVARAGGRGRARARPPRWWPTPGCGCRACAAAASSPPDVPAAPRRDRRQPPGDRGDRDAGRGGRARLRAVLVLVAGGLPDGDRDLPGARARARRRDRRAAPTTPPRRASCWRSSRCTRCTPPTAAVVSTLGQALDVAEQFAAPSASSSTPSTSGGTRSSPSRSRRAGRGRIAAYQVCDWNTPLPPDVLLARGIIGRRRNRLPRRHRGSSPRRATRATSRSRSSTRRSGTPTPLEVALRTVKSFEGHVGA